MSFNCVSKYGLVGGGVFLPYDVQNLIAEIWLPGRYREKYTEVIKQLMNEIAICSEVTGRRMMVELRNKFKEYDENQLMWIIKQFAHSIYWHSSTRIDEDDVLISPHRALEKLNYQELLTFKYYIYVKSGKYPDGYNVKLFTNSWCNMVSRINFSIGTDEWVWSVQPGDSQRDIYLRHALFQAATEPWWLSLFVVRNQA
jgi:hypothetical protein